ncbi:hypothetical protein [Lentibacillus sp. CBA3610]|nr:hypothetical protein [Lentibacillus sp. CBA3610]
MRQILMAIFFVLIACFSIVGVAQTFDHTEDVVEEEDSDAVFVN